MSKQPDQDFHYLPLEQAFYTHPRDEVSIRMVRDSGILNNSKSIYGNKRSRTAKMYIALV